MTVSIIGSNGLLANQIGNYLNESKIDVVSYGNKEPKSHQFINFHKTNLLTDTINYEILFNSDIIIYASGAGIQSNIKQPYNEIYEINAFIPIKIVKELSNRNYKGTFVTFGSYFEIGNNSKPYKFNENEVKSSILEVPNDYCISKRILTRFISSSNFTYKHLHLILPTIYGENEGKHRLIPYTISSIKKNMKMQFTVGSQIRQYLFAGDLPKIIFELISNGYSGIYNISGEEVYSVREIVKMIHEFYNIEIDEKLFGNAERYDIGMENLQLDGSLIKSILPKINYTSFLQVLNDYDKVINIDND